jgi:hypothetical protein
VKKPRITKPFTPIPSTPFALGLSKGEWFNALEPEMTSARTAREPQ